MSLFRQTASACIFVCGLMFADVAVVFIPKQKQAADPPGYGWCLGGKYLVEAQTGREGDHVKTIMQI